MRPLFFPTKLLAVALLLGGVLAGPRAQAQPAEGAALLDAWRAQQAARLRAVDGAAFDLVLERRVDGPMGAHRLRAEVAVRTRLDGPPGGPRFDTDVRALEVDGEPLAPERYERETHPLRRLLGPGASWLERPLTLPYPLLRAAEAQSLTAEARDGRPVWRVDLGALPPAIEEATVWFARTGTALPNSPRLVHSIVQLRLPEGPPPRSARRRGRPDVRARLAVETDYATVDGLDLPATQTLDLVAQQRRRIRTFTVLVEQQLQLRDVRLLE